MKSLDRLRCPCHFEQVSAVILLMSLQRSREIQYHSHLPFLLLQRNSPKVMLQGCIRSQHERHPRLGKSKNYLQSHRWQHRPGSIGVLLHQLCQLARDARVPTNKLPNIVAESGKPSNLLDRLGRGELTHHSCLLLPALDLPCANRVSQVFHRGLGKLTLPETDLQVMPFHPR